MKKEQKAKDLKKEEMLKLEYLFHIKIFYKNGKYKYANLFKKSDYEMGLKLGSIVNFRKMNMFERFIFRNCL